MTIAHYPQTGRFAPVWRIGCWLLAALILGGCASSGSDRSVAAKDYGEAGAHSARSNEVLIRALGLVGTPYRYGGNTPAGGFDCSGLVDFVFLDAAGLRLPRGTRALVELDLPRIRRNKLQAGDLVFFNPGGGPASHIGIYVGEGRFVHAPSAGGTVRLDVLATDYWDRAYVEAKRVLR
jgi:cell wall-associated NlpC family hydrolase